MPLVQLITNLKKDAIPSDFSENLTRVVFESMKWPDEKFIVVHVLADQDYVRGGNRTTQAATLQIATCRIGFDTEKNRKISKTILEFLSTNLKLPQENISFIMHHLPDELVGVPNMPKRGPCIRCAEISGKKEQYI